MGINLLCRNLGYNHTDMAKGKYFDERIGNGKGLINPNSRDFQLLREAISDHASKMPPGEQRQLHIQGMIYRMEDYLDEAIEGQRLFVGACLKELVEQMNIPHKDFASYIGLQHSNLSAIYSGNRRINQELALKLGQIFSMNASIWLQVQSKAELEQFQELKGEEYTGYSLEKLLELVGK